MQFGRKQSLTSHPRIPELRFENSAELFAANRIVNARFQEERPDVQRRLAEMIDRLVNNRPISEGVSSIEGEECVMVLESLHLVAGMETDDGAYARHMLATARDWYIAHAPEEQAPITLELVGEYAQEQLVQ